MWLEALCVIEFCLLWA